MRTFGPCHSPAFEELGRQPLLDDDPLARLERRPDDAALPAASGQTPLEQEAREAAVPVCNPAMLDHRCGSLTGRRCTVDALVE